jgi:hypothetical protein
LCSIVELSKVTPAPLVDVTIGTTVAPVLLSGFISTPPLVPSNAKPPLFSNFTSKVSLVSVKPLLLLYNTPAPLVVCCTPIVFDVVISVLICILPESNSKPESVSNLTDIVTPLISIPLPAVYDDILLNLV